jgi:4-oxalocrotonate tautomerase
MQNSGSPVVFIAGRSVQQKVRLTEAAVGAIEVDPESVRVIITDVPNTDFGLGAQTAATRGRGIGRAAMGASPSSIQEVVQRAGETGRRFDIRQVGCIELHASCVVDVAVHVVNIVQRRHRIMAAGDQQRGRIDRGNIVAQVGIGQRIATGCIAGRRA